MKVLNLDKIQNKKQKDLSLHEIQYLEKLNHPHIIKCYNSFEDNKNIIFLIIDYVNNGNIKNLIIHIKY